jgi:hypothetical protein
LPQANNQLTILYKNPGFAPRFFILLTGCFNTDEYCCKIFPDFFFKDSIMPYNIDKLLLPGDFIKWLAGTSKSVCIIFLKLL